MARTPRRGRRPKAKSAPAPPPERARQLERTLQEEAPARALRGTPIIRREIYRVADRRVSVTAQVGAAQDGHITMLLDDEEIAECPAPVGPIDLGPGMRLVGRLLTVDSFITDVSPHTDAVRLTVRLEGGPEPCVIPLEDQVDTPGGTLNLRVLVLFKEARA